jgi:2-oxoglutarate dehydrogenase E1 component
MAAATFRMRNVARAALAATRGSNTTQCRFSTDSALSGANAAYLESIYGQWKASPASIGPEWGKYFEAVESGKSAALPSTAAALKPSGSQALASHSGGLQNLIRAYQKRGHEIANLDPLGNHEWRTIFGSGDTVDELEPSFHGFTEADMNKPMEVHFVGLPPTATLQEIVNELKKTYSGTAGFEYTHISDYAKVDWIRSKVEDPSFMPTDKATLIAIYEKLCAVDTFEKFLTTKYKTTKRFGIDGGEATVSGLDAGIAKAVEMGVTEVVIGMPHRGRLNILTNVVTKPLAQMFQEFKGTHYDYDKLLDTIDQTDWSYAGDVKYHLGTSEKRDFPNGKSATITLECNPSHLETVDAVTLGRIRAKQYYAGNNVAQHSKMMPVIFHGDASFAGQGVCYETMQLAHVKEFDVGGTIHVVVNNQVGFTTDPIDDRSTLYCTDIGKGFGIPIFHCNADDPVAVARVFELAAEWRQTFNQDVIVDVICYRRYGHNESLNPDYTQPVLYKQIAKHPRAETIYADKLMSSGVATKEELDAIRQKIWQYHEDCFIAADSWVGGEVDWVATKWEGFAKPFDPAKADPTGVEIDKLKKIGSKMFDAPPEFNMYPRLKKQLSQKKKDIENNSIDWGTAELLAWGSLLLEGTHVRITGQDVQPGTFAHRHCVATDQMTGAKYCFLNNLDLGQQEQLIARNSILSEYGVLGFELGYSYENPNALNIWEAQFGDFANTAQVMIDQFISAGEHKWLQQSGLVMLLPHGFEGQGAEHSSARMERFLQMSDDDEDDIPAFETDFGRNQAQKANWQIMNVTTPANLFHAYRRQVHRNFRKPMVVFSTKSLFRHKMCKSSLEELGPQSHFWRLIGERDKEIVANADKVDRLVFCTGKLYYELVAEREALGLKNVAIVSVEQIAPFPFDRVLRQIKRYKNVPLGDGVTPGNIVWCQEEPKNMGAWFYVRPRLVTAFREGVDKDVVVRYVGRRSAASPATGYAKLHMAEQTAVVRECLVGSTFDESGAHRPTGLLGHQT